MGEPDIRREYRPVGEFIAVRNGTQGIEPSQYLKEKKVTTIPIVAASELGRA